MRIALSLTAIVLSGCMASVNTETAREKSVMELCQVIYWDRGGFGSGGDIALAELRTRDAWSEKDMEAVSSGVPYVGMSENAARCNVGFFDKQNTTITENGVSKQHVNGEFPYSWYFYTRNGVVTGIQF
jgi:hypothetical protein